MERQALAAGARLEIRGGWSVAVCYGSPEDVAVRCREAVGWADVSPLHKLEIQGGADELHAACGERLELGRATVYRGAMWCPLTPERALVIGAPSRDATTVVDVTTVLAALTLVGPLARETIAGFCAIDLRPQVTPVLGVRPGSIARQPGIVVREAADRYLLLFGWAIAGYMWTVVEDAARAIGGGPVGLEALARA